LTVIFCVRMILRRQEIINFPLNSFYDRHPPMAILQAFIPRNSGICYNFYNKKKGT
jgi:hypothetical protein